MMYKTLAKYYDLVYSTKDYQTEAKNLDRIIKKYKKTKDNTLLDVACGTGLHIQFLKSKYKITGVDLNKEMLKIARKRCPSVRFVQADISSFNLKKKFDILTCLFSSIGYLQTYKKAEKAIKCFAKHLKKGGLLFIEPFISPDNFKSGFLDAIVVDKPNLKLVRMVTSKKQGILMILDFDFLIGTPKKVEHFHDIHKMAMYDHEKLLKLMNKHGLKTKYIKSEWKRSMLLGIKK